MRKNELLKCAAFCLTLFFFLMGPDICVVADDDFGILNYYFEIETGPRHQWYPSVDYNPIENEFMVLYHSSGKLEESEGCEDPECTNSYHSIDARRVSPDGELLGDLIELSPPEIGWKTLPRLDHNSFRNEYLVAFSVGYAGTTGFDAEQDLFITRLDGVGNILYGPERLYQTLDNNYLPEVIFNSLEREYLVMYNDRYVFNEFKNNAAYILDEDGIAIKGPLPFGNQVGDQYATSAVYNPTDNTYFMVWEDFRHVTNWLYPADLYGALLDAEGEMIAEVTVIDDAAMLDGGDQKVPGVAYNSDRNEFLVLWGDSRPASDSVGLYGRVILADGTTAGPDFSVVDAPGFQYSPTVLYDEKREQYFAVWNDCRSCDPGVPTWSGTPDIYGSWLSPSGEQIGDEFVIAEDEERQGNAEVSLNPVMDRILVVWRDGAVVDDYDLVPFPPGVAFAEGVGDIRGTILGTLSETTTTTTIPQDGTGGCPAVALYGSSGEETKILRHFRDTVLKDIPGGQHVIDIYYDLGPEVVTIMEENRTVKTIVKNTVDVMLPFVKAASP
jgi:hypothetical protein